MVKDKKIEDIEQITKQILKEVGERLDKVAWKTPPFAGIGNVNVTALEELIEALKAGKFPDND